jgi:hypothetical protein
MQMVIIRIIAQIISAIFQIVLPRGTLINGLINKADNTQTITSDFSFLSLSV